MAAPQQIDWPALLGDIAHLLGEPLPGTDQRTPAGTRALADYLRVNRETLRRWLEGSEPRHSDGEVLLIAWCRLSGKVAAFAPRHRQMLSAAKTR